MSSAGTRVDIAVRKELEASARTDPLARGVADLLLAASALALVLAVIGLWVTLASDLVEERRDFVDLEALGATPAMLRGQLRIRSLALLVFGVLVGTALGVALTLLVVHLVSVAGDATTPDPPLVLEVGWGALAIALGCLALVALAALELTIRGSFRGPTPMSERWKLS
jgi:ABC-type antimicrobial peptide transport system permease subunit